MCTDFSVMSTMEEHSILTDTDRIGNLESTYKD